ncbi:MAG: LptF/LptG family permease, partial [Spirochaetales bacterium]|nr:LptF/LptG family permease [Spirochaetales bacterium]
MVQQGSKLYRSSYITIYKYIIIEFILSFAVAFLFFFFIFFVNQLLLMAEDILSKNVSLKHVALIVLYSLPAIISFSLPFSSLVGGLMSVGRLSADKEILALQSLGISFKRLFIPISVMGIILSLFSFMVSDYFLPVSTIKFGKLYREILYSSPELELESYSVKQFQDSIIITGKVDDTGINNLIIIDKTEDKNNRIISAQRARLIGDLYNPGVTSLKLSNVFSLTSVLKQQGDFNYFTSSRMIYNILLKNISFSIRNLTPREMSSLDIYRGIKIKEKKRDILILQNKREIDSLTSELSSEYYSDSLNYIKLDSLYQKI